MKMEKLLNEMKECLVVVEGKRDAKALEAIGLDNVITINGQSLPALISRIQKEHKDRKVLILTDFDKKGRQIYAKITRMLQAYKIPTNSGLRYALKRVVSNTGKVRIEEIKEVDLYGKDSAYFNKIYHPCSLQSGWSCREA